MTLSRTMVAFIGHQPLPNFIPVFEEATRPTHLVGIHTAQTQTAWNNLSSQLPDGVTSTGYEVQSTDAEAVVKILKSLDVTHGKWVLNATGGTKMMTAPAIEMFRANELDVLYVDSFAARSILVSASWGYTELPFSDASKLTLESYFGLFGEQTREGTSSTHASKYEQQVCESLSNNPDLPCTVGTNVEFVDKGTAKMELDVVALHQYRLLHFEIKATKGRLGSGKTTVEDLLDDFHKLFRVRRLFGGPLGRSYFIKKGEDVGENLRVRRLLDDYGITYLTGSEAEQLGRAAGVDVLGLPIPIGRQPH